MRLRPWHGALLAGLLARPGAAAATESPTGDAPDSLAGTAARWTLPPVRITAEALPDPLGPFPLATTRLDRSTILRRPGGDVADLLRPVAGVRVTSRGGPASPSGVSIRGATTNQVLLLVDGRRWQSAQGGGADLGELPLDVVESVEVFRGGASAFWGSDAIGGAIHVRTRPPRPGAAHLRIAGGQFGQRALSGAVAVTSGGAWRGRIAARHFDANGDFAYRDDGRGTAATVRNGDIRTDSADVRLEASAAGRGRLRLDVHALDAERGVPGSEEFPTPSARLLDRRVTVGGRWSSNGASRIQPALDVSWRSSTRRYREADAAFGPVTERHVNDRVRAEGSVDVLAGAFALGFRAGASLDELRSTTDGKRSRDSFDGSVRASADLWAGRRPVRVMLAARVDDVEGFAARWSPRAGLLAAVVPGRLALRASGGVAHRTPSFDELFWPPRASAAGNPDLRPERGRDLDAGLDLQGLPLGGRVSVDAFVRSIDDLIQWIPGAGGVWRPHNVGAARISGVEMAAGVTLTESVRGTVALEAAVTRLRSEDRSGEPNADGRELVYRPQWVADVTARLARASWGELESSLRVVDAVFVTRANTKSLPGYAIADVRYRRPLSRGVDVDLAVTNLLDRTARDFRDYPLPGRAWMVGMTYRRGDS